MRYMSRKVPYQYHFSRQFYEDKKTGYWISSDMPRIRAHRWVWLNAHGSVPKSCHIHHRDGNKGNNDIDNLQMVSYKQHAMLHMDSDRLDRLRRLAEIGRMHAKDWHKSEEGRAWHRHHALKFKFGERVSVPITCKCCQKAAIGKTKHQEFCSNACKSAWRRRAGLDNIERNCPVCGMIFFKNKYKKFRFCSKKCGGTGRSKLHKSQSSINSHLQHSHSGSKG